MIKLLKFAYRKMKLAKFYVVNKRIKGSNNIIDIENSSILTNCKVEVSGNNNIIVINCNCSLNNLSIKISGNNNTIELSDDVCFYRGGVIWIEDNFCVLKIGNRTTFENAHLAVTEDKSRLIIGEDCMFAYDIDVRTGDSHTVLCSSSLERLNFAKDISIGNHVWVSSHVTILKGVELAENTIVATGSIVTKSFTEGNVLLGGNPAIELKKNVSWDRSRLSK